MYGIPILPLLSATSTDQHMQKEKEDLEDVSNELELADEEDMIP